MKEKEKEMSNFWCLFSKKEDGTVMFFTNHEKKAKKSAETADVSMAKKFVNSVDAANASPDITCWKPMYVDWLTA